MTLATVNPRIWTDRDVWGDADAEVKILVLFFLTAPSRKGNQGGCTIGQASRLTGFSTLWTAAQRARKLGLIDFDQEGGSVVLSEKVMAFTEPDPDPVSATA